MRTIHIIPILLILILSNCSTIETAKEITKASKSIKTSVEKIIKKEDKSIEIAEDEIINNKEDEMIKENNKEDEMIKEKEKIVIERKKQEIVIIEQKKVIKENYLGKTLSELKRKLGAPSLLRDDGNTKTVRFDSISCRLFVYFNLNLNKPRAEYYEIRNMVGDLIYKKENISKCLEEIEKT